MNILFITLSKDIDIDDNQSIYGSIIQVLNKKGHSVFVASPTERRNKQPTGITKKKNVTYLDIKTGNIQKTNKIEKGISTILVESQFKRAIKKYTKNIKFDLILYSTPPITFCNVIKYFKKRDNARTYLMLKDIFPQNAVDLGYFSKKSIIYKYFRKKEIKLYKLSDKIGCMSPANVKYLIKHNEYIDNKKIELFPNTITPNKNNKRNLSINRALRKKYEISMDTVVFMYGGNLGKPQGIDFIVECLKKTKKIDTILYIVCGKGTEYEKIKKLKDKHGINNLLLINGLPKKEYTDLLNVADIGLVFLDYRFTIPNFPSRILSYCEKGIPTLCCTDKSTDIGNIAEQNNFGWKIYSNNSDEFKNKIETIIGDKNAIKKIAKNAYNYLCKNYNSQKYAERLIKTITTTDIS